jgi:hypothetical protein
MKSWIRALTLLTDWTAYTHSKLKCGLNLTAVTLWMKASISLCRNFINLSAVTLSFLIYVATAIGDPILYTLFWLQSTQMWSIIKLVTVMNDEPMLKLLYFQYQIDKSKLATWQILTMPHRPEMAVATEVEHTCNPNRYVNVFPVTGMPKMCVWATRGTSKKKLTNKGKIRPYLYKIIESSRLYVSYNHLHTYMAPN